MKKLWIFGLGLLLAGNNLWAAPKTGCAHSQKEYRRVFRDPKSLEKQNFAISLWKFKRVEDLKTLEVMAQTGELIGIAPSTTFYYIDPRFPERLRFIRLFARWFLDDFSEEFFQSTQAQKMRKVINRKTGQVKTTVQGRIKRVKVTSLVRTRDYQEVLIGRLPNGQAGSAVADDPRETSHLAGTTFDVSIRDWTKSELCWALDYLYEVQVKEQLISVIWEPRNYALHIMVFPAPTSTGHI